MNQHKTAISALALSVGLLAATPAFAAGVRAGTDIENTATASYNTGGQPQQVDSNNDILTVDELLDVATAWQDGAPVPIDEQSVLQFRVTNNGNGREAFTITADPAVAGNDFDVTIDNLVIDANNNGVVDDGEQLLANGFTTAELDPDQSISILVLVTAPANAVDGENSQVDLLAEAATGTGNPGDVFAGQGEGGGDAVVGSTGADDNALGDLVASRATVTLVKSSSAVDPFGGTQVVPGSVITYSLVATVNGSGSVSGLSITDAIPANTTYSAGSLTLESASLTDADDADAGEGSSAGIAVDIGTLASNQSRTVTFDVTVNNGATADTQ